MRYLCLLCVLAFLPSCEVTLKSYDEVTVDQIRRTIEHEKRAQAFVVGKLPPAAKLEFDIVSEAEVARLTAWLAAEEAKKLEDE